MWAGGGLVKLRLCYVSYFVSLFHKSEDLFRIIHLILWKSVNIDSLSNTFSNFKIFIAWTNQIIDAFVVKLTSC
jgi:hypothetical protein